MGVSSPVPTSSPIRLLMIPSRARRSGMAGDASALRFGRLDRFGGFFDGSFELFLGELRFLAIERASVRALRQWVERQSFMIAGAASVRHSGSRGCRTRRRG